MKTQNTLIALIALALSGCVAPLLTENTLEGMSTKQIEQGHQSAVNSPWWFDNKEVAKIYGNELERRAAMARLVDQELSATPRSD